MHFFYNMYPLSNRRGAALKFVCRSSWQDTFQLHGISPNAGVYKFVQISLPNTLCDFYYLHMVGTVYVSMTPHQLQQEHLLAQVSLLPLAAALCPAAVCPCTPAWLVRGITTWWAQ
jgi:hypothetical protein